MIDPHWVLEDLDPTTWRAIGRFFMPGQYIAAAQPGEHGLFVLHEGGRRTRVFDTERGDRTDLQLVNVVDPRSVARDLFARGEWDRVHVIDKRHLARVSRTAQASPRRALTLDAYYHMVYSLIWDGSDGYVAEPPHAGNWHGWTYSMLAGFLSGLPSPSALGLCVIASSVEIGLAVRVERGRLVRVTTLEGLSDLGSASVNRDFLETFWRALGRVAPPAAAMVCTAQAFEDWLSAPDKRAALATAARAGAAVVRTS